MITRIRQRGWQAACMMMLLCSAFAMAQQTQQPQQVQQSEQAIIANKVSTALTAATASKNVVVLGSVASMGGLLILIGIVWMILMIMRRLTGKKPRYSKPIILLLLGIILFLLPKITG